MKRLPLISAWLALPAWAQLTAQAPAVEEPGNMGALLVRTVVVLALVVATIYLVLNVGLRRLMGASGTLGGRGEIVRVVERTALDPRRSLYVVEAAGEHLLVGAGEGGITLLAKLDSSEVQRLKTERAQRPGAVIPFLERLKASRGGGSPPPTA